MSYRPHDMTGSVTGVKTLMETPAALFAGAAELPGRSRMRITNLSTAVRVRIGRAVANLQRDGVPIEPGDTLVIHPATTIFGCSEGAAITVNIEEK